MDRRRHTVGARGWTVCGTNHRHACRSMRRDRHGVAGGSGAELLAPLAARTGAQADRATRSSPSRRITTPRRCATIEGDHAHRCERRATAPTPIIHSRAETERVGGAPAFPRTRHAPCVSDATAHPQTHRVELLPSWSPKRLAMIGRTAGRPRRGWTVLSLGIRACYTAHGLAPGPKSQ